MLVVASAPAVDVAPWTTRRASLRNEHRAPQSEASTKKLVAVHRMAIAIEAMRYCARVSLFASPLKGENGAAGQPQQMHAIRLAEISALKFELEIFLAKIEFLGLGFFAISENGFEIPLATFVVGRLVPV